METKILLERSTAYCLAESWAKNITVLMDRPLSAAYWNLGEMTGETMLEELPPLQIERNRPKEQLN